MSLPLRWIPGDRCMLRGRIGVVREVDRYSVTVTWPDGTFSGARLNELELVPESDAAPSSYSDLGALLTLEEQP